MEASRRNKKLPLFHRVWYVITERKQKPSVSHFPSVNSVSDDDRCIWAVRLVTRVSMGKRQAVEKLNLNDMNLDAWQLLLHRCFKVSHALQQTKYRLIAAHRSATRWTLCCVGTIITKFPVYNIFFYLLIKWYMEF